MPSIRLVLIRVFPKIMSTTKGDSKSSHNRSDSLDKRNVRRIRGKDGIMYCKSVDIGYSRDLTNEFGSSDLELVQIGKNVDDI